MRRVRESRGHPAVADAVTAAVAAEVTAGAEATAAARVGSEEAIKSEKFAS
jgi:hypothetical protein